MQRRVMDWRKGLGMNGGVIRAKGVELVSQRSHDEMRCNEQSDDAQFKDADQRCQCRTRGTFYSHREFLD